MSARPAWISPRVGVPRTCGARTAPPLGSQRGQLDPITSQIPLFLSVCTVWWMHHKIHITQPPLSVSQKHVLFITCVAGLLTLAALCNWKLLCPPALPVHPSSLTHKGDSVVPGLALLPLVMQTLPRAAPLPVSLSVLVVGGGGDQRGLVVTRDVLCNEHAGFTLPLEGRRAFWLVMESRTDAAQPAAHSCTERSVLWLFIASIDA